MQESSLVSWYSNQREAQEIIESIAHLGFTVTFGDDEQKAEARERIKAKEELLARIYS